MKVVFLDIDGVLCKFIGNEDRARAYNENEDGGDFEDVWLHYFDKEAVANLNYLIEATGAKIVVSSTWRISYYKYLEKYFKHQGITGEIIGKTVRLPGEERGHEIQIYLDEHRGLIESFVILDDDSDMAHLKSSLIQTLHTDEHGELKDGLRMTHTLMAIAILNS